MRTRAVLAAVAATACLTACTGTPAPTASSASSTTAAPTPTPTPTPDVVVSGADATLTAAVAKVYAGRTGIQAKATLGTWGKESVAVVTSGQDVTLAVGPRWKVVGGWWPSLGKAEPQLGAAPRFVLVVGTDARPNQTLEGTRGDTLQVLGVDGRGGGGLMGIARDVWAPMPGGGHAKINAAFAFHGGAGQVHAVEQVSGLPIEGYVATGFKGFAAIVDESGGLPISVAKKLVAMKRIVVPAGRQTMTGRTALAYARERKTLPTGDFGRSAHQGDLLVAAAVAARVAGPSILPTEMTIVSKNGESDLDATQMLTFLAAFYRVDPTKVGRAVAQGGFGTSPDGQSIVILDAASKAAFARFRSGRL